MHREIQDEHCARTCTFGYTHTQQGEFMGELGEGNRPGDALPLSPEDLDTYKRIAADEGVPDGAPIDRLIALGLVVEDPYRPHRHIALDPRAVAQRLLVTEQAALSQAVERLAQVPALEALTVDFDPHRLYGGPGSEFLPSKRQMNARIGDVTGKATKELYTAQPDSPSDRDPEIQKLGTSRTRDALERGAQLKSLFHSTAHAHEQTREYVADVMKAGADVRAYAGPFPRMVIVDRRHLFIDNYVVEGAESNSGWHVFDRSAVMWARAVFTLFWELATRWQEFDPMPADSVLNERQLVILCQLDAGYLQHQVGQRVGMSDRLINKELANARAALGLSSTNQLMAWYGRWTAGSGRA
ncbi:hypothetical protein NLX86_08430 [Streptomyces sp. A3M-1-3]|uniref:hypothetical protein n=1 Tax=Streptomyces sp. A3M-1-3 TaxID=2962044 RepID=UPI0020B781E6|nr:hypothetical protein [Streptomyces sp. A3M-1-3]MCP3818138.1 hypothetical protein [Streptomyces sp. A3M-1-3]